MNDRNTAIDIREITDEKELALIHQLAAEIFPRTYEELLSKEQIPYMMEMMYAMPVLQKEFADNVHFALIWDESTPIGYISWHDAAINGEKLVKLEKLYVDFAYHHRGIGNLGLRFILEEAKNSGAAAVILNVQKQNLRAQKAYQRAGFKFWQSAKNPIGNGFFMDDFVMRHDLIS